MKENKHPPAEQMKEELDNMLSRINALEIIAKDDYQKKTIQVLRELTKGQIHTINEIEHLKKATNELLLLFFDIQNKLKSS